MMQAGAGHRGNPEAFTAVVTRPAGQSADLLGRLADEGIETFEFPLIEITNIDDDAPLVAALASLDRYSLVMFVSPNAIDHAFARYGAIWPPALPLAVIGPGSVAALAQHGVVAPAYRIVSPSPSVADDGARFDSEALFAELETEFGARAFEGKKVLIVRGNGGREWLAERLRDEGAQVEVVAAYRRVVPEPSVDAWERVHALLAGVPHAWLVTSGEGVRNLNELAHEHLTAAEIAALKHAAFVAPHPRIAETARELGFDSITMSGAGDDRIVRALGACALSQRAARGAILDQSASTNPAPTRMTDSNDSKNVSSQSAVTPPLPPNQPFTPYEAQKRGGMGVPLLSLAVVVLLAVTGVAGFALYHKIEGIDARLTQRQAATETQAAELRVKTEQALTNVHQIDSQFSQLEGKLADAQSAQQALQQQYADLARNRDEWTFAEVEQMLSSASEQLQLTGNTQLALFALQSADSRLAASSGPQALAVRKAIGQDIEKLKAAPSTDLTGLAIKLDNAIEQVDALPLAGEAPIARATPRASPPVDSAQVASATGEPRWKVWWRAIYSGIGQQLTSLVQVRRIDNADAMLNSPEQGHFIRENVKLRLLSARLALLSRNPTTLKSDLNAADAALARYFDASSKRTQTVRELVKEVAQGAAVVEVPNLDTSLRAVHQFKSRG